MIAALRMARHKSLVFETDVLGVGRFGLRRLQLPNDGILVHDWVRRPYAKFWNMGQKSAAEVVAFYAEMEANAHEAAYLGLHDGVPAFLTEIYDPAYHELADHYAVRSGDRGMHVLVAPVALPVSGFTGAVFRTIMDFLFVDPDVRRVVVEPDARNTKIHRLNERFGFIRDHDIQLRDKVAALSFCTRERYLSVLGGGAAA